VLCEAAQTAKRSPQLATDYQAIAKRRGKKIATTAVARKLLTRAWHLLAGAEHAVPQPHSQDQALMSRLAPGSVKAPGLHLRVVFRVLGTELAVDRR
jgi:hypothetical protein